MDSTVKKVLGVAAVGAAGVGAYYLLKKKVDTTITPVITPIVETVNEIKGFSDTANDFIHTITKSKDPNLNTAVIDEALEKAGLDDAPEVAKYSLMPGNVTAMDTLVDIVSDAITNGFTGLWNSITGTPEASNTPISKYSYTDEPRNTNLEEDPREAADNKPVPVTDKTDQVKTITTSTPVSNNAAGQSILDTVAAARSESVGTKKVQNIGAGKTVAGIQSDNKFVGGILEKYGFTAKYNT